MTRNLSVWNSLRPFSVGFDSIFDEFDRMLESSERYSSNYPPYNINKLNDNDYKIEVALAGYSKDDIELELKENNLTVRNKSKEKVINGENNGISDSPLLIIIPYESIDDIDKYNENMKIKIVVKATRVKFDANKIQVIGNIV